MKSYPKCPKPPEKIWPNGKTYPTNCTTWSCTAATTKCYSRPWKHSCIACSTSRTTRTCCTNWCASATASASHTRRKWTASTPMSISSPHSPKQSWHWVSSSMCWILMIAKRCSSAYIQLGGKRSRSWYSRWSRHRRLSHRRLNSMLYWNALYSPYVWS